MLLPLAFAGSSGCVLGGGPVLALRHGQPALGWEAGGGPHFLRSDVGQSTPVMGPESGKRITYLGLTAQLPIAALTRFYGEPSNGQGTSPIPENLFAGWSLGGAWGKDGGGIYVNGFGSVTSLSDTCRDNQRVATLAIGVRWVGTEAEFYVAPRADVYMSLCLH